MRFFALALVALLALAACSRATLPYKPDPQPRGGKVSAAYQVVGDRLRIEIETNGRRLEQAWIMKADRTSVAPQAVETPPVYTRPGSRLSVGGLNIPLGQGSTRTQGNTIVWFQLGAAGPEPWPLYVKLDGVEATTFPVGGPPPPR